MKRMILFLCIVMLVLFPLAIAQNVIYTNQVTIAWDAVTMLDDGSPIPDTDVISYEILIKDKNGVEIVAGETDLLEYTITFTTEGIYRVGVRTKCLTQGQTIYSEINWSNVDGEYTPNPFVVHFFKTVGAPRNIRIRY